MDAKIVKDAKNQEPKMPRCQRRTKNQITNKNQPFLGCLEIALYMFLLNTNYLNTNMCA